MRLCNTFALTTMKAMSAMKSMKAMKAMKAMKLSKAMKKKATKAMKAYYNAVSPDWRCELLGFGHENNLFIKGFY